jgi:N-acetylglucosaminyldiphosphoundecaprenol N-acetyl-beta-D-mannosaminyltransferase
MGRILGVNVASSTYAEVSDNCLAWAGKRESKAVFFANVHVVMEAFDDAAFREQLNAADMVNPDGMPLVWALRARGEPRATRVYGPDATEALLYAAEASETPVGFLGGSQTTLDQLLVEVRRKHPALNVVYSFSPPFRPLSKAEDDVIVAEIAASNARMLFVGLGCPKQERWIMEHVGRVPAVMLGVGAAFDFLAGSKPQAPRWMMRGGFEWAFRLASEPSRLLGRYLKHNPRFVALVVYQWLTMANG